MGVGGDLHRTAAVGRGNKIKEGAFRRESRGVRSKKTQREEQEHCLLILPWLAMKCGCHAQSTFCNVCCANTSFDAGC